MFNEKRMVMSKKIKLEITSAQLESIMNITDEMSALQGVGEPEDLIRARWIRNIDKMLKNHGLKRHYT